MIQFTAIKIFRNGQWEDASQNNKAKGTTVMVSHQAISAIVEEQLLSGDPCCTLTLVDGTQITVNECATAAMEAVLEERDAIQNKNTN